MKDEWNVLRVACSVYLFTCLLVYVSTRPDKSLNDCYKYQRGKDGK